VLDCIAKRYFMFFKTLVISLLILLPLNGFCEGEGGSSINQIENVDISPITQDNISDNKEVALWSKQTHSFVTDVAPQADEDAIKKHYYFFKLKHLESDGIGFNKGYTTASFFGVKNYTFLQGFCDIKAHIFDNGELASNVGLGMRSFYYDNFSFGGNIFYDFRGDKDVCLNQIGGGVELFFGKNIGWYINGYLPVGKDHYVTDTIFSHFQGHHIYIKNKVKTALANINTEVNYIYPCCDNIRLEASIGGYYLFRNNVKQFHYGNAIGGNASCSMKIYDCLEGGVNISYDNIFNTKVNGFLSLSYPLYDGFHNKNRTNMGRKLSYKKDKVLAFNDRSVRRNEIIPIQKKKRTFAMTNSPTKTYVVFVDNSFATNGDGTYENRYNNLASASAVAKPNDIIYIFAGDGTTNNYRSGFVMQDGQRVHGSGVSFVKSGVTVPAMTPGLYPHLDSESGYYVIALSQSAAYNAVSGLNLLTPNDIGAAAILLAHDHSISDLVVEDNQIVYDGSGLSGGGLYVGSGFTNSSTSVKRNTFSGLANPHKNHICIRYISAANAEITDNVMTDDTSHCTDGIYITCADVTSSYLNCLIDNNSTLSNQIHLIAGGDTTAKYKVTNNTLTSALLDIRTTESTGILKTYINNNHANGKIYLYQESGSTFEIYVDDPSLGSASLSSMNNDAAFSETPPSGITYVDDSQW
jgi:hypothetical protein